MLIDKNLFLVLLRFWLLQVLDDRLEVRQLSHEIALFKLCDGELSTDSHESLLQRANLSLRLGMEHLCLSGNVIEQMLAFSRRFHIIDELEEVARRQRSDRSCLRAQWLRWSCWALLNGGVQLLCFHKRK
jgi:hypothetical protein